MTLHPMRNDRINRKLKPTDFLTPIRRPSMTNHGAVLAGIKPTSLKRRQQPLLPKISLDHTPTAAVWENWENKNHRVGLPSGSWKSPADMIRALAHTCRFARCALSQHYVHWIGRHIPGVCRTAQTLPGGTFSRMRSETHHLLLYYLHRTTDLKHRSDKHRRSWSHP